MSVRRPAVAGMFYPAQPAELRRTLEEMLEHAPAPEGGTPVRALIAPHAGYVYSGPIAAAAYRCLEDMSAIQRVVLLGPSHRFPFRGLALPHAHALATPIGDIPIDAALAERALALPEVAVIEEAHALEHSLEVHLPFLRHLLPNASILPLVVGDAAPSTVQRVLDAVTGAPDTLVVVSTDLSHFLDYENAQAEDKITSAAIVALRSSLRPEQACGCRPVNGLLQFAASRRMRVTALDVRNSGDTAGSRDRVVGYGAYALH